MAKINIDSSELLVEFKTAKNKREQINILGDLHCCSPRTIAELLNTLGALEGTDIKPSQFSNVYHPVPPTKPRNKGGRPATVFDYAKAREMFAQGASPTEIALAVDVSRRVIENWMKKNGLWPRKEDKSVKKETEGRAPAAKDAGKAAPRITMEPRPEPPADRAEDAPPRIDDSLKDYRVEKPKREPERPRPLSLGELRRYLTEFLPAVLNEAQLYIDGAPVTEFYGFSVTSPNGVPTVDILTRRG